MAFTFISEQLSQQKKQTRYRQRICTNNCGDNLNHIIIEDKSYINFSSNDYLGLNNHPIINSAMQEGVDRFGLCASASSLVTGYQYAHQSLEETICQWLNKPSCLLFSSGFSANLALFHALGSTQAKSSNKVAFFLDKLSHASMIDGAYQSQGAIKRFAHNDMTQLARFLAQAPEDTNKLIASEGVFSMDGDIPPLPDIAKSCAEHNAWLMVDDAHGFGTLGKNGGGCVEHFGLGQDDVQVLVGTLGKAFGTAGAFVAGSELLIETLIQNARTYIYTTAMPPAIAAATRVSLKLLQTEHWRRERLAVLINRFRMGAGQLGYELMDSSSPIQPILIGSEEKALKLAGWLEGQGVLITAIRPPTVPKGTARLRVTFCAEHTEQQVDRLLDLLDQAKSQ